MRAIDRMLEAFKGEPITKVVRLPIYESCVDENWYPVGRRVIAWAVCARTEKMGFRIKVEDELRALELEQIFKIIQGPVEVSHV